MLGDFTTNEDYMPYLHSLQNGAENTVTGYLNVSVCGGNTANTEFEFLTGKQYGVSATGKYSVSAVHHERTSGASGVSGIFGL